MLGVLLKSIPAWTRVVRRFSCGERGNVAVTFALAALPAIGLAGAAIDLSRGNSLQAALQNAVDATALNVSSEARTDTADQLQTSATNKFKAVFTRPEAKSPAVTASYSSSGGSSVVITGTAKLDTQFMGIIGVKEMTITATSTVKWGSARLRVALVLDNTGSMASDGKMAALQQATKNLLSQLQGAATVPGDVYVSIIPFAKDVNVNAANYTSAWDSWIDWSAKRPSGAALMASANSLDDVNSNVGPGSACPYSAGDEGYTCVTQPGGTTTTSTIPSSGTNKGYICPSNTFGCYDSVPTTTVVGTGWFASCFGYSNCSCTGSGSSKVCSTTSYSHTWFVDKTKVKTKWGGCLTDRGSRGDPRIAGSDYDQWATKLPDTSIPNSMFPPEQYSDCPKPVMGLSYDWTAMNTLVNSMVPVGSTNQPIGLVWGWQSLVGGGPFPSPPTMDSNYQYLQVIILLSDGLNTQDRWFGNGSNTSTDVDSRMLDSSGNGTCANFKSAGTGNIKNIIYAIQVNTGGDPTSTLLQNCASSADTDPKGQKFFMLTTADQIISVFQQIGTSLTKLRIAS